MNETKDVISAYGYINVRNKDEARKASDTERCKTLIMEYAEQNGYKIERFYYGPGHEKHEVMGVRGQMLVDGHRGDVKHIIVPKWSHIDVNPATIQVYVENARKMGFEFYSVTDEPDVLNGLPNDVTMSERNRVGGTPDDEK